MSDRTLWLQSGHVVMVGSGPLGDTARPIWNADIGWEARETIF